MGELKTLKHVYVGIIVQDNGEEGIPAIVGSNGVATPMICSNEISRKAMADVIQRVATEQGKSITIRKFTISDEFEVITPLPKSPAWAKPKEEAWFDLNKAKCPSCGQVLKAAVDLAGLRQVPQVGDLSVCFGCLSYLQFAKEEGADLTLIVISPEAVAAIEPAARKMVEDYRSRVMEMRMQGLSVLGTKS